MLMYYVKNSKLQEEAVQSIQAIKEKSDNVGEAGPKKKNLTQINLTAGRKKTYK